MSEPEVCNCDHSKTLLERAQHAEAKLQLVHSHVRGLARRLDGVLALVEEALRVPGEVIDSEFAEVDDPAEGAFTELTDESERLVPGEYREEVLACGAVEAREAAFLHVPTREELIALSRPGKRRRPRTDATLSREDIEAELRRLAEKAPSKTTAEYAEENAKMDPNAWRRLVLRMAELIPARSKSERP